MNVLVIGGAGYIGTCVIEKLLEKKYKPIIFDSLFWGKEHLKPFGSQIELIEGDARNSKELLPAIQKADAVILLSGIVGEPSCKKNPNAHYTQNIEAVKTVVSLCTDPELELTQDFLFASSCSVYGNVNGLYDEVTEDTPTNPLSEYAAAKLRAEHIIMDAAKKNPHFHPTVLRLTTVFGWSNKPRIDLVTNLFSYKAVTEGTIQVFGGGSQYRSLIHVKDVADAFVTTLGLPRFMRSRQVFQIGEETNNKSVMEIAKLTKKVLPKTIIEERSEAATDRRDYKINCQKFKNTANWKASYTVEDGIKELVEKFTTEDLDWDSGKYRNNSYNYE